MKILFCSPYTSVGGISRWTQHILKYIEKVSSHDVFLEKYYPASNSNPNGGASVFKRLILGLQTYIPMCLGVNRKLKSEKYELLHLCSSASVSLIKDYFILKSCKRQQVNSVVHFHFGRIPAIYLSRNWEYKLIHKVISLADKVIVIDLKSYNTLLKEGYKNIELLPNPLTPQVEEIVNSNANITVDDRKLLFAGHTVPTKGVFELIEACKQIPDIKLKMIGLVREDMRTQLLQAAGEGNQSWLEIAGEQDYETTIKEMMSAGVFVLPTYTEGFPNVILESMACGCPIVTTDVGAIPEMLDIENGFDNGICVKPKDVQGLKEAILKMLNDREYAVQCGLNAQKRVKEQYSMPIVWDKMVEIWKSTIN